MGLLGQDVSKDELGGTDKTEVQNGHRSGCDWGRREENVT